MKHSFQSRTAHLHEPNSDPQIVHRGDELLTEDEARRRVRVFDTCKEPTRQFQKWARKYGCPVRYVGRRRLYVPRLLDAFLEKRAGAPTTVRRRLKLAR